MTDALNAIVEEVEAAGFDYLIGYGGDILDFLTSERVPSSGIVFVSVGGERPKQVAQNGKARAFVGTFTLWIRTRVERGDVEATYARYTGLRDALNGKPYDGGRHTLAIVDGGVEVGDGFAEPQLTIEGIV